MIFVFVYSRSAREVEQELAFSDEASAETKRAELEGNYAMNDDIEVVVLEAQSKSELEKTHSRYFGGIAHIRSVLEA